MSKQFEHETLIITKEEIFEWTDAYAQFMEILDRVIETTPDHEEAKKIIQKEVDELYAQHEGDPAWDLAYERWIEPSDDDEEVK